HERFGNTFSGCLLFFCLCRSRMTHDLRDGSLRADSFQRFRFWARSLNSGEAFVREASHSVWDSDSNGVGDSNRLPQNEAKRLEDKIEDRRTDFFESRYDVPHRHINQSGFDLLDEKVQTFEWR